MSGVPAIPRTGLPAMTPEATEQRRSQLFYSSPFAAGSYIIRGGTILNDTGAVYDFVEGLLLSRLNTADNYVTWDQGDDTSASGPAAAAVLLQGKNEVADAEEFLASIILVARGGLRVIEGGGGAVAAADRVGVHAFDSVNDTVLEFVTDYIAGTNADSIGAANVAENLDPDSSSGSGDILFFG